jgi:hypothetical protein
MLNEGRFCNSMPPAERFFCLTNAYLELAIIIVLGCEEGPVLDCRLSAKAAAGDWK